MADGSNFSCVVTAVEDQLLEGLSLSELLLCRVGSRWLRGSAQQPLARRLLTLAAADGKKHREAALRLLGQVVEDVSTRHLAMELALRFLAGANVLMRRAAAQLLDRLGLDASCSCTAVGSAGSGGFSGEKPRHIHLGICALGS